MSRHSGPQVGEVGAPFKAHLRTRYLQVVQEVLTRALPKIQLVRGLTGCPQLQPPLQPAKLVNLQEHLGRPK